MLKRTISKTITKHISNKINTKLNISSMHNIDNVDNIDQIKPNINPIIPTIHIDKDEIDDYSHDRALHTMQGFHCDREENPEYWDSVYWSFYEEAMRQRERDIDNEY